MSCGVIAGVAWPWLRDGLDGVVTIDDERAAVAMRDLLWAEGIRAGESGAAGFAALDRPSPRRRRRFRPRRPRSCRPRPACSSCRPRAPTDPDELGPRSSVRRSGAEAPRGGVLASLDLSDPLSDVRARWTPGPPEAHRGQSIVPSPYCCVSPLTVSGRAVTRAPRDETVTGTADRADGARAPLHDRRHARRRAVPVAADRPEDVGELRRSPVTSIIPRARAGGLDVAVHVDLRPRPLPGRGWREGVRRRA